MHESLLRLLEVAKAATAGTGSPITTLADLGTRLEASPQTRNNWKTRGVSKDAALSAQRHFGCSPQFILTGEGSRWTADRQQDPRHPKGGGALAHETGNFLYGGGIQPTQGVPVIGTLEVGSDDQFELRTGAGRDPVGFVAAHMPAPGAFAVRVIGDALYPVARHGACLIVEPDGACIEGELVLIETALHHLVRELVALRPDFVTVLPPNGGKRETLVRSDTIRMAPIGSIVAASKFRTS